MIYKFEILTEDTLYEGWARNKEEMEKDVKEKHGISEDFEVFLVGNAPHHLTLSEYRKSMNILKDLRLVHIFDEKIGMMLEGNFS